MLKQTDPNIKTIRFTVLTSNRLQTIADKCGMTRLDCFAAMVDYFYKSKKDPRDLNDELLKKELVKRTDRVIAFIRTMEDELLRPLITSNDRIDNSQQQIINFFNKHIITHNKALMEAYAKQETTLKRVDTSIRNIETLQLTKEMTKRKCIEILDFYIQHREAMGMMTKQMDKDNLVQNVRGQMKNV